MSMERKQNKQVKSEIVEDAPQTIASERMLSNWLDQVYADCEKNGGFDNLAGKGKPVEPNTGDPLSGILKNANYLPPWLTLQHEIRDSIRKLIDEMESGASSNLNQSLTELNKQITRYNTMVPSTILQKMKVSRDTLKDQFVKWL